MEKNVSKSRDDRSKKNKRKLLLSPNEERSLPLFLRNVNDESGTMSSTRKRVIMLGDSMLNGVNEKGLSRNHFVEVHAHGGATSEDLFDHIKPVARRAPNLVIIHFGTNDLTKDVNTIDELQKLLDHIKKESSSTDITISSIITRTE